MFAKIWFLNAAIHTALGLTFNTPTNAVSGGVSIVSWTATSSDPTFDLELNVPATGSIVLALNVDPSTTSSLTVQWPSVSPEDDCTLNAVNVSNINQAYSQSDEFTIAASVSASIANTSSSTTSTGASSPSPGSSTQTSNQSKSTSTSSTTSLAMSGSFTPTAIASSANEKPIGAIVGGVVGGVVALVLVGLFTFLSIRRRGHGPKQEGFERGALKHPEDEMRVNPTSDGSVPLWQVVTTEDADISNPQVEQRANSPLLHGAFFSPLTPNPSFHPATPSLDSENPHSPRSVGSLLSTYDIHDTPEPGSPSTARATWGGVRYKVASEADKTPSQNTNEPEQAHPIEAICRDEEQPLDTVNSDSRRNSITSPLPLQAPNQTQELNNQGHDLTGEDTLLLELQSQISRRLAAIRGNRSSQTPPPEYASS